MSREASGEPVQASESGLGIIAVVASPAAREALPILQAPVSVLCTSNPVGAMRQALEDADAGPLTGLDTLLVMADCEPLSMAHAPGTVYRAVDYINAMADSPLIGTRPAGSKSFFVDMITPFSDVSADRFKGVSSGSILDAVLVGAPPETPLDDSQREWMRSIGGDIASAHGTSEAIAARALGFHCMALFYVHGDRIGIETLHTLLAGLGIPQRESSGIVS